MKVIFSYTYYSYAVDSDRQVKDQWSRKKRARMYGLGLLQSAKLLSREWPHARMVVYIPALELEKQVTRVQKECFNYVKVLRACKNVDIVSFSPADIGEAPHMKAGQLYRMSRYLPFLRLKKGCACVARDADSVLSLRDIDIVKRWIKDDSRDWLIYQEVKMGKSMPMGGGIGLKNTNIPIPLWSSALLNSSADEYALSKLLPSHLVTHLENRETWPRMTSRSLVKLPSCMFLRMRMARNGDWYDWSTAKHNLIWKDIEDLCEPIPDEKPIWIR